MFAPLPFVRSRSLLCGLGLLQLLKKNAQYIAKEPTVEKCNELGRQFFFTNLAR